MPKRLLAFVLSLSLLLVFIPAASATGWHILGVTVRGQEASNWCWAASAQMILEWNGTVVDQCSIVSQQVWWLPGCANQAMTVDDIKHAIDHFGNLSSTTMNSVPTWSEVKSYIGNSQPFAFRWGWNGTSNGHFLLATGWEEDSSGTKWLRFNDPLPENMGTYRKATYSYVVYDSSSYPDPPHTWTHTLHSIH